MPASTGVQAKCRKRLQAAAWRTIGLACRRINQRRQAGLIQYDPACLCD